MKKTLGIAILLSLFAASFANASRSLLQLSNGTVTGDFDGRGARNIEVDSHNVTSALVSDSNANEAIDDMCKNLGFNQGGRFTLKTGSRNQTAVFLLSSKTVSMPSHIDGRVLVADLICN